MRKHCINYLKKKRAENSTEKNGRVCMGLDESCFTQIMGLKVRPSPRPIFAKYASPGGPIKTQRHNLGPMTLSERLGPSLAHVINDKCPNPAQCRPRYGQAQAGPNSGHP